MCSKTLGPATTPSFVTWPTIKMEIPIPFAICINTPVDSRTCDTLPGAEETSSLYMVCMESMITICGFSRSITVFIVSKFVSHKSVSESPKVPIRSALILICCRDSSPDIYNTRTPFSDKFRHTCKSSVDLPIPGSPPTNTKDPCTIPPPSTRSSSFISVDMRLSCVISICESGTFFASAAFAATLPPFAALFLSIISSTNVFHSLHAGHCPIHFDDS